MPAHVLIDLLELSEPMLREAIRELVAADLCENVGPEGAPLSERLLCTSILALPPTSPYLLPVDSAALDGLVLADSTRTLLLEALDGHRPYLLTLDRLGVPRPPRSASRIFVLVGPAGSGKETLATAIAAYAGLQFHRLSTTSPTREPEGPMSIEYLTYLQAVDPLWTARDHGSLDDSPTSRFGDALKEVETWLRLPETPFGPRIKILGVAHRALLTPALLNSADAVVDLEHGSLAEHREMWRTLVPAGALAAGVDAGDLAELAPLAPGAIVTTLRRALRAAQAADSEMGLG
ncbi:MAG: hypothetical protein FJ104_13355, partial [Deltaproteobacteria bacterium]|nr:hypothetical protein [Deltaproteobacteria bacterium]